MDEYNSNLSIHNITTLWYNTHNILNYSQITVFEQDKGKTHHKYYILLHVPIRMDNKQQVDQMNIKHL